MRAAKPDLRLLKLPAIDTLRLGPLAFPRIPYHGLVKHYRDGGLKRGRVNDPELDSRIALKLFGDEREALGKRWSGRPSRRHHDVPCWRCRKRQDPT